MSRSELEVAPLQAWLRERLRNSLDGSEGNAGIGEMAAETGVPDRTIYRLAAGWETTNTGARREITHVTSELAERLLREEFAIVYPLDLELEDEAWCHTCRENMLPIEGKCPWCDTPVGVKPIRTTPKRRRDERPKRVTLRTVKAPRAGFERVERPEGELRPTLPKGRRPYKGMLSRKLLRDEIAWLYYYEQWGFVRIARWLRENRPQEVAYAKSENSLANGIHSAFERLGWPRRDRVQATQIASYKHGYASRYNRDNDSYRRWHKVQSGKARPRCVGTVETCTGRIGARCARPAKHGSKYCAQHDPATAQERADRMAAMRAKSSLHDCVNVMPFTLWLRERAKEYPTQKALAAALAAGGYGRDRSGRSQQKAVSRWLRGQPASNGTTGPIVSKRTVRAVLAALGGDTQFGDLYPSERGRALAMTGTPVVSRAGRAA
jgi:hypothetical protein